MILVLTGSNIVGCAARRLERQDRSRGEQSAIAPTSDVNTGLIALGSGDVRGELIAHDATRAPEPSTDTSDLVNQAAVDLERILAEGLPRRKNKPDPKPSPVVEASSPLVDPPLVDPPRIDPPQIDPQALERADAAWNARAAQGNTDVAPAPSEPASQDAESETDEKLIALAGRIAALLRERTSAGEPVLADSVAVAMLDAYEQGACEQLDDITSTLRKRITEEDARTLIAARDAAAQEERVPKVEQVREAIATVAPAPVLRISDSKLCTKVTGFGAYNVFASNAFPSGKSSKAIVYTAVEGFEARPAVAGDPVAKGAALGDMVTVELEQSLTLYQDSDDYQVWHRPAQIVKESGSAKRRDFYLIQIIEFAPTLAPGRYNLKIRLKDRTTGAITESMIPVDIVTR